MQWKKRWSRFIRKRDGIHFHFQQTILWIYKVNGDDRAKSKIKGKVIYKGKEYDKIIALIVGHTLIIVLCVDCTE